MERSSEKKKENFLIFREKWVRILSAKKERKERREPVVAILGHSTEVERDVDMATTTVVSSVGFKRATGPGLGGPIRNFKWRPTPFHRSPTEGKKK